MYTDPYLTKQLIAYIGNKRSLLPFLSEVFDSFDLGNSVVFSDPFSGSGSVSRLAKYKGYQVHCNDWEYYSYIANSCYIGINANEKKDLFKRQGGITQTFKDFNNLSGSFDPYISKYYAPKNTIKADYLTERLFYTKENGEFIDRARGYIKELYPGSNLTEIEQKEKNILLASLLFEVSTHANTSGVFKACHKGFGGHGKDALGRIMAPMEMEIPHLVNSEYNNSVSNTDALEFVKGRTTDICYLDPPYNIHQYGSNYFMLNTVALWDKPAVNQERGLDGRYKEKAGIRKDWIKTKSPYCYRDQAQAAFIDLMDNIDARYIILSYNTEGIIPFTTLFDIMEMHGKVSLHIKDYVLYRGGKQSLSRKNYNMELLLVVDRKGKPDGKDRFKVKRFLKENQILTQLRMAYSPKRLDSTFNMNGSESCRLTSNSNELKTFKGYNFLDQPSDLGLLTEDVLEDVSKKLLKAQCADNFEETMTLISLLEKANNGNDIKKIQKRILIVYKKLAFKKYIELFNKVTGILNQKIKNEDKNFLNLTKGVKEIEGIAELRFKG